jgi:predicted AAA+ superfamily ATPase
MYDRIQKNNILSAMYQGEIIILVGARQVGKTTIIESILAELPYQDQILRLSGDYSPDREFLSSEDKDYLIQSIGDHKIIFIDEPQFMIYIIIINLIQIIKKINKSITPMNILFVFEVFPNDVPNLLNRICVDILD